MSTLVLGDLHLKQRTVLPRVMEYLADPALDVRRVVFLGDACDEWGATPGAALEALAFYADWVDARRAEGLQVDVLVGNHDLCYIRGRVGSGTIESIMREVRELLEDRLHVQMATTVGRFLCCHAGITQEWADKYLADVPMTPVDVAAALNAMLADSSQWAVLDSAGPSRGGWKQPGPVWADACDMAMDAVADLDQMVGHTPVGHAGRLALVGWQDGQAPEVWVCDSMSLTRSGAPIGDGSMALVNDAGAVRGLPFPGQGGYPAAVREMPGRHLG